ncbi:hypothetical protein ACC685_38020, partial [Rhizobium ruizarguesonis]
IGAPVTLADSRNAAAIAYLHAARRLVGGRVPRAIRAERRSGLGGRGEGKNGQWAMGAKSSGDDVSA